MQIARRPRAAAKETGEEMRPCLLKMKLELVPTVSTPQLVQSRVDLTLENYEAKGLTSVLRQEEA